MKLLHQASTLSEAFKDVCLLGRVWLRQRGLGKSIAKGGFGPFEWAALCAALLEGGGPHGKPVLAYNHDNHQLFKSMLQFIASKNLTAIPDLSPTDDPELSNSEIPVFFDGPRAMNILYKMSPWSYSMVRP